MRHAAENEPMYVPPAFREDDTATLHAAIRGARLATLVTAGPDGPFATHLPMLLDPEPAPFGTLIGHIARANPHARMAQGTRALVIFQGPDAYVTPSWYGTKQETGKVVPTWNYVAVHAVGEVALFDEPDALLGVVRALTERHEGRRAEPWSVSDAPDAFIAAQLKGIVGVRIPIARLEGKWKLSQNRPEADRVRVRSGLSDSADATDRAVAALMPASRAPG
jgi:transcriptional regulator